MMRQNPSGYFQNLFSLEKIDSQIDSNSQFQQSFSSNSTMYSQKQGRRCNCQILLKELRNKQRQFQILGINYQIVHRVTLTVFFKIIMKEKKQKLKDLQNIYEKIIQKFLKFKKENSSCENCLQYRFYIELYDPRKDSIKKSLFQFIQMFYNTLSSQEIRNRKITAQQFQFQEASFKIQIKKSSILLPFPKLLIKNKSQKQLKEQLEQIQREAMYFREKFQQFKESLERNQLLYRKDLIVELSSLLQYLKIQAKTKSQKIKELLQKK